MLKKVWCVPVLIVATIVTVEIDARFSNALRKRILPKKLYTDEIIKSFGYPVESYYITTHDSYILRIFRIPKGLKPSKGSKTPIILHHGLLSSSDDYVANFPHQSLGFVTADAGYDVWISNNRGNTYGRNHTTLNPDKDKEFWKFSLDQMAEYDMPTIIDFVLNKTGYKQLYYVGHSMGCATALAMLSTKPEYNQKIKILAAMAPAVYVGHMRSPFRLLASFASVLRKLMNILGTGEQLSSSRLTTLLGKACVFPVALKFLCSNLYFLIMGYDKKEFNASRLNFYLQNTPAGTSTYTIAHYAQSVKKKTFRKFDWGFFRNLITYGQSRPPDYELYKVTTPVITFWGANDWLADPKDVKILESKLTNLVGSHKLGGKDFNHGDFLLAIHADTLVNPHILAKLPKF